MSSKWSRSSKVHPTRTSSLQPVDPLHPSWTPGQDSLSLRSATHLMDGRRISADSCETDPPDLLRAGSVGTTLGAMPGAMPKLAVSDMGLRKPPGLWQDGAPREDWNDLGIRVGPTPTRASKSGRPSARSSDARFDYWQARVWQWRARQDLNLGPSA